MGKKKSHLSCVNRLLNPSAKVPPLPSACCLPSPGSFQHKARLWPDPSRQADHPARPKEVPEGGYMSPFGPSQWLLPGWPDCAALGSLPLDGGSTNRRWLPEPLKAPGLGLSSTHTSSGVCAWLGSAGAKAHLIHSMQLRHLSPLAGPQEIAVQSHYLRQSLWSALSNFVTGYQWQGIPKLGLLSVLWFLNITARKFPFSTENRRTAKEMTHKW